MRKATATATAFDPVTSVPGIYAAWMADKGVTATTTVSAWAGQSSNGWQLTQGTTGNQPAYTASDTDGKPSLTFNGVNTLLVGPAGFSLPGDPSLTIYLVCQPSSVASGSYLSPFGWGNGSGSLACFAPLFNYPNAAQPSIQTGGGNGVPFVANLTTTWQQFTWQKSPGGLATTLTQRRNGASQAISGTASSSTPSYTSGTINVGRFADYSGYFFNGKLRELLIYNAIHTSTQMAQVESYLSNKWPLGA